MLPYDSTGAPVDGALPPADSPRRRSGDDLPV